MAATAREVPSVLTVPAPRRLHPVAAVTALLAAAGALLAVSAQSPSTSLRPGRAPKLIVLLVVDQMRGDYVERFQHEWTGGFHRLLAEGARFTRADYPYANTVTCAGHATISTGSYPSVHGMIEDAWFDRATATNIECTEDAATTVVSYGPPGEGSWQARAARDARQAGAGRRPSIGSSAACAHRVVRVESAVRGDHGGQARGRDCLVLRFEYVDDVDGLLVRATVPAVASGHRQSPVGDRRAVCDEASRRHT